MSQLWQVAMRELRERGRSKAFLFSSVITLILVLGMIFIPRVFGSGTEEYTVGLLGEGNQPIVTAALGFATADDEPGDLASVEITTVRFESRQAAVEGLDSGEVDAVLVDGTEVVVESVGWGGSRLLSLLGQGAAAVALERLIAEEGQAVADVIELLTSDPLTTTALSGGEVGDSSRYVIAYAGLIFLYVAILLYGTWMLTGVTEEKSTRVVEVLLSSLRPWQLLGGKILGIGLLGLAQFATTVLVAFAGLSLGGFEIPDLDPLALANLIFWFILGFTVYALLFGAAGSLASRVEDANNAALPMSMIAVVGLFISFAALDSPAGMAARIGTMIPITAPFVVPVRVSLEAIAWWEFALSVILTLAAIIGLVWAGGRIYAGGVLRYGGKVRFRDAWRSAAE